MDETLLFSGSVLLGILIGALATLLCHLRQIRREIRENYVRLSLAQAEIETRERILDVHRGPRMDRGEGRPDSEDSLGPQGEIEQRHIPAISKSATG